MGFEEVRGEDLMQKPLPDNRFPSFEQGKVVESGTSKTPATVSDNRPGLGQLVGADVTEFIACALGGDARG
jgi:hypothetical protein